MKGINKGRWYIKLIMSLLAVLGAWSFVSLARLGLLSTLEKFGLVVEWQQHLAIVILVLVVFVILGLSFKKSFKKLAGI